MDLTAAAPNKPAISETASGQAPDEGAPGQDRAGRERSTIAFPYVDLDDAIEVAKAIHENGGDSGTTSQLASWLDHSTVDSGGFRMKMAGARLFGLVRFDRKNAHITTLGRQIIDPTSQPDARARAFLQVPLFKKVFEKYDGYPLPSDNGLESVFANFGVAEKQKSRARQIFQRSAQQAGYFSTGKNRLVAPKVREPIVESTPSTTAFEPELNKESIDFAIVDKKHPLIAALYRTIPDEGAPWDFASREKWLATAKSVFDLIYS